MNYPFNNLKKVRKEIGVSIETVADHIQVDPKTIYRYETSQQAPNLYVATRLAAYYHKTLEELFCINEYISSLSTQG